MNYFESGLLNQNGQPIRNASVAVYTASTLNLASLFSDNGVTPTGNPVMSDVNGRFSFYVATGTYDLTISGSGLTTYTRKLLAIGSSAIPIVGETPSGVINGSNVFYTLANAPNPASSLALYLNGDRQIGGFTVSGLTLTLITAPQTGDQLYVDYAL